MPYKMQRGECTRLVHLYSARDVGEQFETLQCIEEALLPCVLHEPKIVCIFLKRTPGSQAVNDARLEGLRDTGEALV